MADDIEGKGFVIKDRRRFSSDGEPTDRSESEKESTGEEPDKKVQSGQPDEAAPQGSMTDAESRDADQEEQRSQQPVKIDFSGFVFSLYTSAAFHFGDMADPATGKKEKNLVAAKQMIDIMAMLQEKTQGNLTDDEQGTIDALLYELRMRYVKET